jgi:DNA topoisomerase I
MKEKAKDIKGEIENEVYFISKVEEKEEIEVPPPPFDTSALLIECSKKLKWNTYKTQKVAQILYEGVQLENSYKSLITYIRTDSLRMSDNFILKARDFIKQTELSKYLNTAIRKYTTKDKLAQQAHEAIRPADPTVTPESSKR